MKLMTSTPAYMPHPTLMPAPFPQAPLALFHPQAQAAGQKLTMPFVGHPGYPMWQFMPPIEVDTSKDSENNQTYGDGEKFDQDCNITF